MSKKIAISSKEYSAGEIITKCMPLLHAVKYEYRGMCCDNCLKFSSHLKKCGKCGKLNYCDPKCQRLDWRYHKLECPVLSKYKLLAFERQGFDYMQRLVLRLYLMCASKPDLLKQKFLLHNGLNRSLNDMESHSLDIENTKPFEGIVNYFKLYSIDDYDRQLVLKLYGIMQINAFGIDVYDNDRGISHCASGLYIEGSVFDHCCQSNACASGEGLTLEIRALKRITIGEEISIDYVQNIIPKVERQSILNERYYFLCKCFRCESHFDENFNYEKFNDLETKSEMCFAIQNYRQRHDFIRIFYPYFHPNYTYFLYKSLKQMVKLKNSRVDTIECNKLIDELKDNIAITHGKDHTFYQMLLSLL